MLFVKATYPRPEAMGNRGKKKNHPQRPHLTASAASILEYFLLSFFKRSGCFRCMWRKMKDSEGLECAGDDMLLLCDRKIQADAVSIQLPHSPK